jgi:uncharacterized protein
MKRKNPLTFFQFLTRMSLITLGIPLFLIGVTIVFQDFLIFPGALFLSQSDKVYQPPQGITKSTIHTRDGETLSFTRAQAALPSRKEVALLFHGNTETLESISSLQLWFNYLGITNFAVEYRGFNESTGRPSEKGIYEDADTAMKEVLMTEGASSRDVIVFGNSIGTAPATYIAKTYNVGMLILSSPFTSLKELVRENHPLWFLHLFLRYEFPSDSYISQLTDTCVIGTHGMRDRVVPYNHSLKLRNLYKGKSFYSLLTSSSGTHQSSFSLLTDQVHEEMNKCRRSRTTGTITF